MQYVAMAEHPPQLCPTSNAQIRDILKEGVNHIPALAQKLGIEILSVRVFGPDHIIMSIIEAGDIEAVRSFFLESGFIQWNTIKIHATWSLEEALEKIENLAPIF